MSAEIVRFPKPKSSPPREDAAAWLAIALSWPLAAAFAPLIACGALARAWLAAEDEWQCRGIRNALGNEERQP